MNVSVLIGRCTADAEVKKTQSGMSVCRFTLAVNRRKKDEADFISCIAFDKTADFMGSYVKKGNRIGVKGHIQTGSYERDGHKVYTTDVIAESIDLLESRQNSQTQTHAKTDNVPSQPLPKPIEDDGLEISSDDLPFGG